MNSDRLELVAILDDGRPARPLELTELARDVTSSVAVRYGEIGASPPWIGYLAVAGNECIGTCAFKFPPVDGRVEIAYFTFPDHEGRGWATEMARQLVVLARDHDPALTVVAQTLPTPGASTRILEKLGFECEGEVDHPEDGTVWSWVRATGSL